VNTEIEIKAWVDDFDDMDQRLRRRGAEFKRRYVKRDSYLHLSHEGELICEVRLRYDGDEAVVTQKEKTVVNGLESNAEREFLVSHAENFLHLLESSGYRYFIEKSKEGNAYRLDDFLIELSVVKHLGVFIEIEKVLEGPVADSLVAETDGRIRAILSSLGISESAIEGRPYTGMLAEKLGVADPRRN
jgi:predicted adenylyl cyclase CyaB